MAINRVLLEHGQFALTIAENYQLSAKFNIKKTFTPIKSVLRRLMTADPSIQRPRLLTKKKTQSLEEGTRQKAVVSKYTGIVTKL